MKTIMTMLALALGLTFGAATFATADEKAAAPATAPAEKKDADKKDMKAEKKDAKDAKKK